jgi:hypothetical protein
MAWRLSRILRVTPEAAGSTEAALSTIFASLSGSRSSRVPLLNTTVSVGASNEVTI